MFTSELASRRQNEKNVAAAQAILEQKMDEGDNDFTAMQACAALYLIQHEGWDDERLQTAKDRLAIQKENPSFVQSMFNTPGFEEWMADADRLHQVSIGFSGMLHALAANSD
ncbi:MAG: hypothetical protein H6774_02450 [Pseudomonadales bacterium]|nr:hypothetical protein [Candidatus Woesebacteria bacterium]MCB9801925.1 hypothetical protein [Pseudomonadales bacterium]